MVGWTGGLPPAAHDRVARQRASGVAGSMLSAAGAAAIRSVALQPVGEVFGCVVMQLGWAGGGCGVWASGLGANGFGANGFGANVLGGAFGTSGTAGPWGQSRRWGQWVSPVLTTGGPGGRNAGFGAYVTAFARAWHGAVDRMLAEAAALGADGVVGVVTSRSRLDGQAWEFTALGTAVRSLDGSVTPRGSANSGGAHTGGAHTDASHPGVWAAGFSAEEVTAAVQSGFVPRGIALGVSVSTKHEDQVLKQQRSAWNGNTEIDGLTELVGAARDDARTQLVRRAAPLGGTDLVITHSHLAEFETPCGEEVDLHAEASFVGTVLGPGPMHAFRDRSEAAKARRDVLTVLPLTDPGTRTVRRHT